MLKLEEGRSDGQLLQFYAVLPEEDKYLLVYVFLKLGRCGGRQTGSSTAHHVDMRQPVKRHQRLLLWFAWPPADGCVYGGVTRVVVVVQACWRAKACSS